MTKLDVLQDIKDELHRAISEGRTYTDDELHRRGIDTSVSGLAERGRTPASALLEVRDEDVFHAHRDLKPDRLPWEWYRHLPLHVAAPKAVLYDKTDPAGALLMVFDIESETAKLVVKIDYKVDVRGADRIKRPKKTNIVRSGKFVDIGDLRNAGTYEVLEGGAVRRRRTRTGS